MLKKSRLLWFLPVLICFVGCGAAKIPHMIVPDYAKRVPRLIAVMEVRNDSDDPFAAAMLREKLVEELYFKGYPKISVKVLDGQVAQMSAEGRKPSAQQIGERLKVDAVLYATLREAKPGRGLFYAPTSVVAEFELWSARTGENLWRVQYHAVHRSFGITPTRVQLKASQFYEPVMQEVVNKVLETLPDAAGS